MGKRRKKKLRDPASSVTRRDFMKGAGLTIAAVGVSGAATLTHPSQSSVLLVGPGAVQLSFRINGKRHQVQAEPWMTLLDVVAGQRERTGIDIETKGRLIVVLGVDKRIGPVALEKHVAVGRVVGLMGAAGRG